LLLNLIDSELEQIVKKGKGVLFLPSELKTEAASSGEKSSENSRNSETNTIILDTDIEDAKALLTFTIYLLENSTCKSVYNSAEVLLSIPLGLYYY
jgi:hypothetical protein